MKARTVATAVATLLLSLTGIGNAVATPAGGHGVAQVNGAQLRAAMLLPSAFGDGFTMRSTLDTGHRLLHQRATRFPHSMSCENFELGVFDSGFGNTAGADSQIDNQNWPSQYPTTVMYADQEVFQFGNDNAAVSLIKQAQAKYQSCRSFTSPNPGDTVPGGGTLTYELNSTGWTSVAGVRAFYAILTYAATESPALTFYVDVMWAVSGADAYQLYEISGINDVPYSTMTQMVHRVQGLYRGR
jgi:hypothetical protein